MDARRIVASLSPWHPPQKIRNAATSSTGELSGDAGTWRHVESRVPMPKKLLGGVLASGLWDAGIAAPLHPRGKSKASVSLRIVRDRGVMDYWK